MVKPIVDKIVCYSIFNNFQWQEMRYYSYQMAYLRGVTTRVSQKKLKTADNIGFGIKVIANVSI